MKRSLRLEFHGALFHLTSRGDHQEPIFLDADRKLLLELVETGGIDIRPTSGPERCLECGGLALTVGLSGFGFHLRGKPTRGQHQREDSCRAHNC